MTAKAPPARTTHVIDLRDIHTGDITRVTCEESVLDPVEVISVWPWTQGDFCEERHADDVFIRESKRKDHTEENPEWRVQQKPKLNGMRVTFITEGGTIYAAVDWTQTEDPPILYLLVIDDADPDARRWDREDRVEQVERYGEPEDRTPEWTQRLPSKDIPPWEVEQDAEPDYFS